MSRICGFRKTKIGFYECGRIDLNERLIETIIFKMGYTMDDFRQQMEVDEMPFEIIRECNEMMKGLDIKILKAVRAFLQGFTNN